MFNKRINIILLILLAVVQLKAQTPNPVGDAVQVPTLENCFRVTDELQNQNGAVWYDEQLDLTQYFALNFEVYMGDQDQFGADGIVFVMQQVGIDALGNDGFGLGFSGFSPSFGVELDTFENENALDPEEDHMAMFRDGEVFHQGFTSLAEPVPIMPDGSNVENGETFSFKLVWNPATQVIQAFIDCELRISTTIDLVSEIFQNDPVVYWGFTGSTGWFTNEQVVCFTELEYLHPTENAEICLGDDLELSIATPEAENVTWSNNVENLNSTNPIVTPETNQVYTVSYEKCGEFFTDTTLVNVVILDIEDIDSQSICDGGETTFQAVFDPDLSILWSNDSAEESSVIGTEGQHWAEVSDAQCVRRKYFDLNYIDLPQITVQTQVEYCFNDSTEVSFSAPQSDLFVPSGEQGNSFYVTSESVYQVQAVDQVTGCENSAEVLGIELPLPQIALEEHYEICPYETLTVEVNSDYDVVWSSGSTLHAQEFVDENTYSVQAELDGCFSTHEFFLQVNPLPVTSVPGFYEFCEDTELILSSDNSTYDFLWPSGQVSESYTFDSQGFFNVQITDQETGCLIIDEVETFMILNPTIELAESHEFCRGDRVTVEPLVENADSIVWSIGFEGTEFEFSESEEFTVSAINECLTETIETEVEAIICDCTVFTPLAFTPDNDGLNEIFLPILRCEPFEYELLIFNRWGEVIFKSNNVTEGWPGNANNGNHFVSPGTYQYKLSYKAELFDGIHAKSEYGMVSVIR